MDKTMIFNDNSKLHIQPRLQSKEVWNVDVSINKVQVEHIDWEENYKAVRRAAGIETPGMYLTHKFSKFIV